MTTDCDDRQEHTGLRDLTPEGVDQNIFKFFRPAVMRGRSDQSFGECSPWKRRY